MAKFFKVDTDTFIEFDPGTKIATTLTRKELQEELTSARERLAQIPDAPTDTQLLAWAKEHYPMMDYSAEKSGLVNSIAKITKRLEGMK